MLVFGFCSDEENQSITFFGSSTYVSLCGRMMSHDDNDDDDDDLPVCGSLVPPDM